MEPKQEQLSKLSSLMKGVASKAVDPHMQGLIHKSITLWIEVASTACSLIDTNSKLKSACMEGKLEQFFQQQNGIEKLKVCIALRVKLLALVKRQEKLAKELGDDAEAPLTDLLKMGVPESLLTETSNQNFDDLAAHKATSYLKTIEDRDAKFVAEIAARRKAKDKDGNADMPDLEWIVQWTSGGKNDWRRQLADDAGLDDLIAAATETIYKIPAHATRNYCLEVEKARLDSRGPGFQQTHWYLETGSS